MSTVLIENQLITVTWAYIFTILCQKLCSEHLHGSLGSYWLELLRDFHSAGKRTEARGGQRIPAPSTSGVLSFHTVDIWGGGKGTGEGRGGCPVNCRVLSSIPDLCPLDASSTPGCDNWKYLQTLQNWPWVRSLGLSFAHNVQSSEIGKMGRWVRAWLFPAHLIYIYWVPHRISHATRSSGLKKVLAPTVPISLETPYHLKYGRLLREKIKTSHDLLSIS